MPLSGWGFPNRATPPGSSAYYSVRFSPPALRDAIAVLFAWRAQVRAILDQVSDPGVAQIKLDWWRDETRRMHAGAPRHPLGVALCQATTRAIQPARTRPVAPMQTPAHLLPLAPFLELADQVGEELRGQRLPDQHACTAAGERDLGALFSLIAALHQPRNGPVLADARYLGGWCAQVRRMRDGGALLRHRQEVVPADQLRAAGLDRDALAAPTGRDRLPALLLAMAPELRLHYPDPARLAALPTALRIQARLHAALLDELEASAFAVVDQRIGLTPLRKLWLAWRVSRGARQAPQSDTMSVRRWEK